MNLTKNTITTGTVLTALLLCGSAFASGGKAWGGGQAGGGKGTGTDASSTLMILSNGGASYNGKLPAGSVTLGYAADGSPQSISFSLSNVNVPNGTVLPVRVITGHLETIFTYYQITHVVYVEVDGSITISHGSASLSLSKLNGDVIPDFVSAAAASGTTEIAIQSPNGAVRLLDGITGSFHA